MNTIKDYIDTVQDKMSDLEDQADHVEQLLLDIIELTDAEVRSLDIDRTLDEIYNKAIEALSYITD